MPDRDRSTCRSCDGPVLWATNEATGKSLPLDPEPVDDGGMVLVALEPGARPTVRHVGRAEDTGIAPRYTAHPATCPKRQPHHCHAEGCTAEVAPRLLMCARHWRLVPRDLQADVWDAYVPGQERRKDPTRAYLAAAHAAIEAVATKEGRRGLFPVQATGA